MDVASGQAQSHPSVLGPDPQPAVAAPTPRFAEGTGQGGVMPTTDMFASQAAAGESAAAAAMSSGMASETDRRAHYQPDLTNTGAGYYGDSMTLPPVPAYQLPPPPEVGYPSSGDEPPLS